MKEVRQVPLLTREQEQELGKLAFAGDEEAQEQLFRANLLLVVKIANRYSNFGVPLADLVSEGNFGLRKAVTRFDPELGNKFSTYASWWIKQAVMLALGSQGRTIRLPMHVHDKMRKVERTSDQLTYNLGRAPTTTELGEACEMKPDYIRQLRISTQSMVALDAEGDDGVDTLSSLAETLSDPQANLPSDVAEQSDESRLIDGALSKLNERERAIIEERFGLHGASPKSLEDIGKIFRVTRERVRQIQNSALGKLRKALKRQVDENLLTFSFPNHGAGDSAPLAPQLKVASA